MLLKIYMIKYNIKMREFADILGCDRNHLGQIANGRVRPGKVLANLIEAKTNGEVTADYLRKKKYIPQPPPQTLDGYFEQVKAEEYEKLRAANE